MFNILFDPSKLSRMCASKWFTSHNWVANKLVKSKELEFTWSIPKLKTLSKAKEVEMVNAKGRQKGKYPSKDDNCVTHQTFFL